MTKSYEELYRILDVVVDGDGNVESRLPDQALVAVDVNDHV